MSERPLRPAKPSPSAPPQGFCRAPSTPGREGPRGTEALTLDCKLLGSAKETIARQLEFDRETFDIFPQGAGGRGDIRNRRRKGSRSYECRRNSHGEFHLFVKNPDSGMLTVA